MHDDHIIIKGFKHNRYHFEALSIEESISRSSSYFEWLDSRRSVRHYASRDIPKKVIENIIKTASTAPSGAHKQPWTFCAVSNPELKHKIRLAAETEEREFYSSRISERWRKDLDPLGTDEHKPFIEDAPWIIVVFKRVYEQTEGEKYNNYYVNESIGIASGILITAIHNAGLVTLTHTPSPMNFLTKLLNRPANERAYLLLPIGYPNEPSYVPDLKRKSLEEVAVFYE